GAQAASERHRSQSNSRSWCAQDAGTFCRCPRDGRTAAACYLTAVTRPHYAPYGAGATEPSRVSSQMGASGSGNGPGGLLGAAGPRIEIDDAYIGGERTGEGAGRGRRGHTPFIIAVETSSDGRPLHTRLQVVRGFQAGETKRLCARVVAGTTVVSDGGQWFRCIAEQPGIVHQRHVTGSDRSAARHPAFRWANTMLANIKNSLLAAHRVVAAKHLPRYLGAFAWRFNRRFVLKTIHERLAIAATTTPPQIG